MEMYFSWMMQPVEVRFCLSTLMFDFDIVSDDESWDPLC